MGTLINMDSEPTFTVTLLIPFSMFTSLVSKTCLTAQYDTRNDSEVLVLSLGKVRPGFATIFTGFPATVSNATPKSILVEFSGIASAKQSKLTF